MLKPPTAAGQQLDRLFRLGTVGGMTDSQLLEQFVTAPDAAAAMAFEFIVERHGPMVLRVCRAVLRDEYEAEDAFQATFLVLARKARTLDARERLGNWLYGVAHRTARKAKAMAARRRIREQHVAYHRSVTVTGSTQIASQSEMEQVLHEEIDRLPRSYRVAVVVCYLEGLTQSQAAQQLCLAESTIRGRLARARKLLGQRLTRRGVVLSTGLLAIGTSANAGAVRLPVLTAQSTARAALLYLKRGQAMKGVFSVTAPYVANGVLSHMWLSTLKNVAAVVLAAGLVTSGAALTLLSAKEERLQPQSSPVVQGSGLAIAALQPNLEAGPVPRQEETKTERAAAKSIKVDPDLAKQAPGSILQSTPISKDCMILAYLPNQNLGHVDNFGLANNDGGVRTLIDWAAIPAKEATMSDRRFLIALYSRKTTSRPPAGSIHAFEILESWPELNCWKMQPKYDPEPAATYRFEPGDGWKLFDITSLVQSQAKGGRKSHGVLLRFLSEDFSSVRETFSGYDLVSREGTAEWASRRPQLLVVKSSK